MAELLVTEQVLEEPDKGHGGGGPLLARAPLGDVKRLGLGQFNGLVVWPAFGDGPAKCPPPLVEIDNFRGIMAGMEIRRAVRVLLQPGIGNRNPQVVPEFLEVVQGEFLHLVGRVAALEVGSESVALDGFGEDDGGFALEFGG
ncbi:hypothetical protein, partial [Pseudarthrobacter sp. R1]|uniref:hypothetical protein n=1 Tax=Pseudarthrobacter sp. R1 TaxID=2944934 RepID=UPI0035A95D84